MKRRTAKQWDREFAAASRAADEGYQKWFRIDTGDGERTETDFQHVAAAAMAYYDDAEETVRGGEFRTPFAIYVSDTRERLKAAAGGGR